MKIIQSIESKYSEQHLLYEKLQLRVNEIFEKIIKKITEHHWFYFYRLKEKESYALKIETGREIDDFFGCTLVVDNLDQINKAQKIINDSFNVSVVKPKNPKITHKDAYSFEFDDLRIYAYLKQPENLPEEPITKLIFEIQIKTFLQHAWTIATHDLVHKADNVNWSKQRIAYQIKAALEQAEVTISGVNQLVSVPEISKNNFETIKQIKILDFYKSRFKSDELPKDLLRLCKNTQELLRNINLTIGDLKKILKDETENGRGTKILNLSPFLIIIQSIINQRKDLIEAYINREEEQRFKIVLPKELQTETLDIQQQKNIVQINDVEGIII